MNNTNATKEFEIDDDQNMVEALAAMFPIDSIEDSSSIEEKSDRAELTTNKPTTKEDEHAAKKRKLDHTTFLVTANETRSNALPPRTSKTPVFKPKAKEPKNIKDHVEEQRKLNDYINKQRSYATSFHRWYVPKNKKDYVDTERYAIVEEDQDTTQPNYYEGYYWIMVVGLDDTWSTSQLKLAFKTPPLGIVAGRIEKHGKEWFFPFRSQKNAQMARDNANDALKATPFKPPPTIRAQPVKKQIVKEVLIRKVKANDTDAELIEKNWVGKFPIKSITIRSSKAPGKEELNNVFLELDTLEDHNDIFLYGGLIRLNETDYSIVPCYPRERMLQAYKIPNDSMWLDHKWVKERLDLLLSSVAITTAEVFVPTEPNGSVAQNALVLFETADDAVKATTQFFAFTWGPAKIEANITFQAPIWQRNKTRK